MKTTVIQKLERMGFSVIASRPEDKYLTQHLGELFVINFAKASCKFCKGRYLYALGEIVVVETPPTRFLFFKTPLVVHSYIEAQRICLFCNHCGEFVLDERARRTGVIGGNLPYRGNLFNVLGDIEMGGLLFSKGITRKELLRQKSYHENRLRLVRQRLEMLSPPYRDS